MPDRDAFGNTGAGSAADAFGAPASRSRRLFRRSPAPAGPARTTAASARPQPRTTSAATAGQLITGAMKLLEEWSATMNRPAGRGFAASRPAPPPGRMQAGGQPPADPRIEQALQQFDAWGTTQR